MRLVGWNLGIKGDGRWLHVNTIIPAQFGFAWEKNFCCEFTNLADSCHCCGDHAEKLELLNVSVWH